MNELERMMKAAEADVPKYSWVPVNLDGEVANAIEVTINGEKVLIHIQNLSIKEDEEGIVQIEFQPYKDGKIRETSPEIESAVGKIVNHLLASIAVAAMKGHDPE